MILRFVLQYGSVSLFLEYKNENLVEVRRYKDKLSIKKTLGKRQKGRERVKEREMKKR